MVGGSYDFSKKMRNRIMWKFETKLLRRGQFSPPKKDPPREDPEPVKMSKHLTNGRDNDPN